MPLNLLIQKSAKSASSESSSLTFSSILGLEVQRVVSRLLFVLTGPVMAFLVFKKFNYKLDNLRAVRKQYRTLLSQGRGPVLICSNHLTYVDSIIQSVFLSSSLGHFFKFRHLPWHLPERTNFCHNRLWSMICYLGKCIPVMRSGPPSESKKTMQKILHVLERGDVVSIFPEGKRSRSGRIDTEDFSYAVGKILKDFKEARVLCIYMRDNQNGGFADFPEKNANYYFKMELLRPVSKLSGMRKVKDISSQVIFKLKDMEDEFFND